jgi:hypothetical protein
MLPELERTLEGVPSFRLAPGVSNRTYHSRFWRPTRHLGTCPEIWSIQRESNSSQRSLEGKRHTLCLDAYLAPRAGFEPTTKALTAPYSTIESPWNIAGDHRGTPPFIFPGILLILRSPDNSGFPRSLGLYLLRWF